jgi:hypothetical protein
MTELIQNHVQAAVLLLADWSLRWGILIVSLALL